MTPTLALEQLMLHPAYERFIQQARRAAPTALVDQLDAADRDAQWISHLVTEHAGNFARGGGTARDFPAWLRLGLLDTIVQWADGKASTCRHSPSPQRPEPVLAAAWKPGVVSCVLCAHLWATSRAANRTCDSCGRLCAGPEHGDGIYPGMVQSGALIYQYGTCADCRPVATNGHRLSGPLSQDPGAPRGKGTARRAKARTRRGTGRGRAHRKD